jgi:hypothetical protein
MYSWIDRAIGPNADASSAPYPVSSDYFVNKRVWRDYEFWNKSIVRELQRPDADYLFTGGAFEKLYPRFDPATGASDISPTPYVLQAIQETRFRIAGPVKALEDAMLIQADEPWRLAWLTKGLYPDGWTEPDTTARVRVYAAPDQRGAVTRWLTVGFRSPGPDRPVSLASNLERWSGQATTDTSWGRVRVCVPEHGFADVRTRAQGASEIPDDLRAAPDPTAQRIGGVLLSEISVADEFGPRCRPRSPG